MRSYSCFSFVKVVGNLESAKAPGGTGRDAGGCGLGKVGPGPGCGGSPVTSIVVGTVPARTPTNHTLKIKPNVSFMV